MKQHMHMMNDYVDHNGAEMRRDYFGGEHVDGPVMQREQEMMKTKHFHMFMAGHEGFHEEHGDRNREGRRDPTSGYE